MMKNIVLVGFMGTGKTVVAKALALSMGKRYVSVDELIEEREERSIKDIFEKDGEAYFRRIEKEIVKEVSGLEDLVLDPGGGVVLDGDNMRNLKENGTVICLWAEPEVIRERTSGSSERPLLNVKDPEARIREMLDERRPFYEKADMHIDTTELTVEETVSEIKKRIQDG